MNIDVTASDEESTSSSCNDGPHTDAFVEDEDSPPLVMRMMVKLHVGPMADNCHQLPSLVHMEGTATSIKWSIRVHAQNQQ